MIPEYMILTIKVIDDHIGKIIQKDALPEVQINILAVFLLAASIRICGLQGKTNEQTEEAFKTILECHGLKGGK